MSAHPWLAEMPPAHCPEGCVVYKDGQLGSVTYNHTGKWCVTYLGRLDGFDAADDSRVPTPESAGWRHALCDRRGFGHVLQTIGHATADESDDFMNEMLDRWGSDWDGIGSADRLRVARKFAEVSR